MNYYQDHLITLYNNWKKDPDTYQEDVADTINRFIFSELKQKPNYPVYGRWEDNEDLFQDLRLKCLTAWNSVEDPTNKRITNYLKRTIKGALLDKHKDLAKAKKITASEKKSSTLKTEELDLGIPVQSAQLQPVAQLLVEGLTQKEISEELGISVLEVANRVNKLRNIYEEKLNR